MTLTRKLLHVGATALMLSTVASVTTFVSADYAYAERGNGNGNGNGRANRDRDRPERGNSANSNGRGAIASELKWMNAAHANQNALENASPNSRPGQLYVLQTEAVEAAKAEAMEAEALALFEASLQPVVVEGEEPVVDPEPIPTAEELAAMSDEEIMAMYPDSDEAENYIMARASSDAADDEVDMVLDELTGGEDLSPEAMAELERLLRIAELAEADS